MTQETRFAKASKGRRALAALVVTGTLGLSACSSVPDALNPVEWYHGASDTVGGWFEDDKAPPPEPEKTTAGDPGPSQDSSYPNLATVPPRPTPSTTPAEREALRQGLVADRANARYTSQPGSDAAAPAAEPSRQPAPQPQASAPAPVSSTRSAPAPTSQPAATEQPAAQQSAARPAPQQAAARPASQQIASTAQSNLWPNRPPPETPGLKPSTTGRVGHSVVEKHDPLEEPALPRRSTQQTAAPNPAAARGAAERTTLDSAGSASVAAPPRAEPAAPRAPAAGPSATNQSVIVNEDAIGGPSAPVAFSGRPFLALTVYFGHGSARLTESEREAVAEVARTASTSGAAVQVIGHASSRTAELGLREHEMANFTISLKRAQAVADALVAAGLSADRVQVEALSDSQPEFYEVMPSGEAGNRRVEVVLLY